MLTHDFNDGFVSINYEATIGDKRKTNLRIGIYPSLETAVAFPITISWITKPLKKHHFEYGAGLVYRVEYFVDPFNPSKKCFHDVAAIMLPIMYRYQKNKGLFFRAGVNVFVS